MSRKSGNRSCADSARPNGASRCLALVTGAFGSGGGIAQYNRDFLNALAASGLFSSVMVLPRHAHQSVQPSPRIIMELGPREHRLAYALAALRLAGVERAQALFCGHLHMAPLAALAARLCGAKLIIQMHGIEVWRRPNRAVRMAVESADLVLCVSRHTRAMVLGWAAMPPERLVVLPNTVGDEFAPGDGAALRRRLGLEGKRILLTVGRMDKREQYKGQDRVIAAIPELAAAGHDVAYVVVGEGDDRARLDALAAAAGVADRVMFLGGLDVAELIEAYRMADIFVMPSTGEGFGIAFLEAMACGTPALGLAAGGAVDALADGELGTLASEQNLPAAIAGMLAAPKTAPEALSAKVRARFGAKVFAAKVGALMSGLNHSD